MVKRPNGQTSAGVQLDTDQRFVKQLYVHSEVCYIRLDLESFTILGPATNAEPSGGICVDSFAVTVSQKSSIVLSNLNAATYK